jgi:4-hydroxybenzoate polyprenyltransferase/phosphoserine phosphatase
MENQFPQAHCSESLPLVVDVDGTLLKTDLLAESFLALLVSRPGEALRAICSLFHGKAHLKKRIADTVPLDIRSLPVNQEVLALVKEAIQEGRKVYLASASDRRYVEALAGHFDLFDGIFASDGKTNLRSEAKATVLCDAFGERGYDYIGNSAQDFAVWQKARVAIVAGASNLVCEIAKQRFSQVRILHSKTGLRDYLKAMRVHQWLKNILIFVPVVTAHKLSLGHIIPAMIAFVSFSLCASSVYLLNDMFDLTNDRHHPVKRNRPLACGNVPLINGALLIPLLLAVAFALALLLPIPFICTLVAYYILTLAYSLWLKRIALIDVITLACLYGMRIASGAALGIMLSEWLVAFSVFLFLSLAMVKRCAELIDTIADGRGDPRGRGYVQRDIAAIENMASSSGYVAVLVLALYIHSPEVTTLYTHPQLLWGACLILIYWISRALLLTHRGEMHDDPVVFAVTDRPSLLCGVILTGLILASV